MVFDWAAQRGWGGDAPFAISVEVAPSRSVRGLKESADCLPRTPTAAGVGGAQCRASTYLFAIEAIGRVRCNR